MYNYFVSFIFMLFAIALSTLLERKVLASIQRRKGPNVHGILGFLQPFADGLKLLLKETIAPEKSNYWAFILSPAVTFFLSIKLWTCLPLDSFHFPSTIIFGVFSLLIYLSLGSYGLIFGGWSSNSKYAFLGGMRTAAQVISYEICLGFCLIMVCLMSHSMDIRDIVNFQNKMWYIFPLFPFWVLFFISILAESNRAPFDLPEAEAELVAGYNVEYSALAFALYFLAEYLNLIMLSTLSALFFFGGWSPFFFCYNIPLPGSFWLSLKVMIHVIIFIWIRATLPRYRYDQLMKLGWQVLLPCCLFFILLGIIVMVCITKLISLGYY